MANVATKTRNRKPLVPVSGTANVLRPVGAVNDTTGEVSINGRPYYLTVHATGYRLTGFDAKKARSTVYDLPADLSSCDCPDATYRGEREGGCKVSARRITRLFDQTQTASAHGPRRSTGRRRCCFCSAAQPARASPQGQRVPLTNASPAKTCVSVGACQ
jgi:hypothetical protein